MSRKLRAVVTGLAALLLVGVCGLPASAGTSAVWSSTDKWGTWSNGGYTVRNDVWGSGAGPQTIWANSYSNWGVWANHPNTGGVKAYPHSAKAVNKKISALGSASSSFNVTVPGAGAYATAYDLWLENNAYEIMLWVNKYGPVGPLGSRQTTLSVGGHTWDVYRGSNGANQVFSFVRTSNTNSGTVDIKAVLNWLRGQGWFGDVTLGEVQFGFEITSSNGGLDFASNSYSVTAY
ncbi:glycoside hydrolase family 12 protein [Goodfellowiella coeruleoviolacea]|uniref:Glycosyl hydrolase family 12 n=1 Tax=Goodfellowiella coeruleoviolacea TaxID=334858 RepID=A0AAE3KFM7_9PSEU|nr:hypothetical protein [Goodfellowiella coeruleoviolacea]MCP2166521.1 Glycosyl hydrolase family 12 [Goodfellowiella coeruleoviolacea]